MPIKVDRHTGKVISAPEFTQEQNDKLWEIILQTWIKEHPGEFRELVLSKAED